MTASGKGQGAIYLRPVEILQNLIRFDTTNPPGNEEECIRYIDGLLAAAGIQTSLFARDAKRPNLMARLAGAGKAPPLFLYGHVDVVTTENQQWQHPPFEGRITDGCVWGRGALDMKGGVAMMLAAFLRAKAEGVALPGDVILTIVSDEERGGEYGAKYLVENHSVLFEGVRHAIGEFGGFSLHVGKRRFYPIMVSEKCHCLLKATIHGPSGHGSLPMRGGVAAKVGAMLQTLDTTQLPVHVTPVVKSMVGAMSDSLPFPASVVLRQLLRPGLTDRVLSTLGANAKAFEPLFHNTVNVTGVHGGEQVWGIPGEIRVDLAASMLPGYEPKDVIEECRSIVGGEVKFEFSDYEPVPPDPDMSLFKTLVGILQEGDPEGVPVPMLFPSPTDGRTFSRLGIQTYGFIPMKLPPDFALAALAHAADERIPLEAMGFGADAIFKLLQRFGG